MWKSPWKSSWTTVTEARELEDRVARLHATLNEARELMEAGGVEFAFDFNKERDSYLCVDHLSLGTDI